MQPPAGHIFISYSRRDDETMRRTAFFLRDQGFKVWVDNEKLIPGTAAWEESIEIAIKNAFAVVILLSPDSKNSEWVRREITYADQFEKRLFPVLVKGTGEESIPLRLITRQYVDLRKDEATGLNALAAAVRFFIEQKQTLEMKRPEGVQKKAAGVESASKPDSVPGRKSTPRWVFPLGCLLAICLAGGAALGYRLFVPMRGAGLATASSPAAETPPESPPATPAPSMESAESDAGILSAYLSDVQVVGEDSFDDPAGGGWDLQVGTIENGVLEIPGNEDYDGAFRLREISAGEGAAIDFQFQPGSVFEIFLDRGEYNSADYVRMGAYFEDGRAYVNGRSEGINIEGAFTGTLVLEPGTVYSYLIAVLNDGEILQVVWAPSDPSQTLSFRDRFDPAWSRLGLTFFVQAGGGLIRFDNFKEFRFSGGK